MVVATSAAPMRFIPAGAGNTVVRRSIVWSNAVYPRWRGEHARGRRERPRGDGLSPLARGTPSHVEYGRKENRFIPAGAGNTAARSTGSASGTVYPRWRGEHRRPKGREKTGSGLSPLARGTLPICVHKCRVVRFIPAGAGNTPVSAYSSARMAVYPRWRGEHSVPTFSASISTGLSPLARGTH